MNRKRPDITAVIFDLDGVVVHTDKYHERAWMKLCSEENLPFDRSMKDKLRGISREACLEIILQQTERSYTSEQKKQMCDRKNTYYVQSLHDLTAEDVAPEVIETLHTLQRMQIATAIGSASKNAKLILQRIGLMDSFDAIVDGNDITAGKPDPEVFMKCAYRLGIAPENCLVVEDAEAGVAAARQCGMKAAGIGPAARLADVDLRMDTMRDLLDFL